MSRKYCLSLQSLLPPGIGWQGEAFQKLILGLSKVFERIENKALQIFVTELPDSLLEMQDEWARILDIKDPNQAKITGKLGASSGQNIKDYQALLQRISSTPLAIQYMEPSRVGMEVGEPLASEEWAFAVLIFGIRESELETIRQIIEPIKQAHVSFLYFIRGEDGSDKRS